MTITQSCRGCGCSDFNSCPGGCYWVKPDLCSQCFEAEATELVDDAINWANDQGSSGITRVETTIAGRIATIEFDQDVLIVRDHIRMAIFTIDPDGYSLAPHYEVSELRPLFQRAA